jgi:ABC-type transport system involved in multi-copper enzyme maturation permease subunit
VIALYEGPIFLHHLKEWRLWILWSLLLAILGYGCIHLIHFANFGQLMSLDQSREILTMWIQLHMMIFALLASVLVIADDRDRGTDKFLRRLPIPRSRQYAEKLAAAALGLTVLWAAAVTVMTLAQPGADPRHDVLLRAGHPAVILTVTTFGGYLLALLLSLFIRQQVVVFMLAFGLLNLAIYAVAALNIERQLTNDEAVGLLSFGMVAFIIFCAPLLLSVVKARIPLPIGITRSGLGRLTIKALADSSPVTLIVALLLVIEILAPEVATMLYFHLFLLPLASIGLGNLAVSEEETRGLSSLLYHHPIPRLHLLLAKIAAGIVPVALIVLTIQWTQGGQAAMISTVTVTTFIVFAFLSGLFARLALQAQGTSLMAAILVTALLGGFCYDWLGPSGRSEFFTGIDAAGLGMSIWYVALVPMLPFSLVVCAGMWRLATSPALLASSARDTEHHRVTWYLTTHLVAAAVAVASTWVFRLTMLS